MARKKIEESNQIPDARQDVLLLTDIPRDTPKPILICFIGRVQHGNGVTAQSSHTCQTAIPERWSGPQRDGGLAKGIRPQENLPG